jgi:hypothetical protein
MIPKNSIGRDKRKKKKIGEESVVFYGLTKLSIFDLLRK